MIFYEDMRIKLLSIICLLLIGGNIKAQDSTFINKLDSLGGLDDSTKAIMTYNEGLDFMNSKKYSEAISKFNSALTLNPGLVDAKFSRGMSYMQLGSDDKAIGDWQTCIKDSASYEKAYTEIISYYFNKGDYKNCKPYLDKAKVLNPKESKYHYNEGVMHFVSNNLDSALLSYNQAIQLNSKNAYALNDRAGIYVKQGELDKAIQDYENSVKADGKLSFVYNNLGSAYRKKELYDKAIASYTKAVELDDKYAIAINNRGMAYFAKGEVDKAKADFDKAISLKIDYALAYNNRASVYIQKEEWNLAVKDCNRAIEIDSEYAYAYYNRGIAKEMLRDLDNACQDWNKSYELGLDAGKTHFNTWCNR